jgi:putative membrane protein
MEFSHWSAKVVVLAAYLVVAIAHLGGMREAVTSARRRGQSLPLGLLAQAVSFQIGLMLALLALVSPMSYWSYRLIWVRNLQDVVLAIVAPALIVLGAPWLPLRDGLGLGRRRHHHHDEGGEASEKSIARPGWQLMPILATVAFCVTWWVWHLPGPFDAALRSPAVYAAEVITYLGAGTVLWLQLIGSRPLSPAMAPLHRVALVVAVVASGTLLGLIRAYGPGLAYPDYLGRGYSLGSVVSYQQAGGAILWVIPLIPFSIVAVALAVNWLKDEEAGASEADFDRLLRHKSAWPSRPGLR